MQSSTPGLGLGLEAHRGPINFIALVLASKVQALVLTLDLGLESCIDNFLSASLYVSKRGAY